MVCDGYQRVLLLCVFSSCSQRQVVGGKGDEFVQRNVSLSSGHLFFHVMILLYIYILFYHTYITTETPSFSFLSGQSN